jgi:hypothetical protein
MWGQGIATATLTMKGIQIEDGQFGRKAVITSTWSEAMFDYLVEQEIAELKLNDGKGWRGSDLSFLERLPRLQAFRIIDLTIASVEPVHYLHELRVLGLITYCQTEIRFSAFPRLEECDLQWRPKAESLFSCKTLRKLFLDEYRGKSAAAFSSLTNLEWLAILSAPLEDIQDLSSLSGLRSLRLANLKHLGSLRGIERLTNMEELEIHTCPAIKSIEEIGSLSRLRKLYLNDDGDIESLNPLNRLRQLESVLFYESTNIVDGDISPLTRQPNLSRVSFRNRRHYSHRREDFDSACAKTNK